MNNRDLARIRCFLAVCSLILAASCNKHDASVGENGKICVTRLAPKATDYKVSGANLDSIYAIFSANNLSINNLQFWYWMTDTTVNVNPGAYSGYQEQVQAIQFFNGLPVLGDMKFFSFNAGWYQPAGVNDGYSGPVPGGDTIGHQSMPGLRNAFLDHVSQSYTAGGPLNAKPFVPSASTYTNACLNVTLGYLDASRVPGSTTPYGQALVKVWSVTPSQSSSITFYPLVYVRDDTGAAWGVPFLIP